MSEGSRSHSPRDPRRDRADRPKRCSLRTELIATYALGASAPPAVASQPAVSPLYYPCDRLPIAAGIMPGRQVPDKRAESDVLRNASFPPIMAFFRMGVTETVERKGD